jgi:uncharacterized membrane-anchored protein
MKNRLALGVSAIGIALALTFTPVPSGAKVSPTPTEAPADSSAAEQEAAMAAVVAKAKALKPVTGTVTLPEAKATLKIPEGYGFLDAGQARTLLVDIWGNPPEQSDGVLGVIMKAGTDFTAEESWAAVVTYADDGYVTDKDAADIEPTKLLASLKEGEAEDNEARAKDGFPAATITGWAEPPYYDNATKRIYWAQRLKFADTPEETLNYKIRILGREGFLAINFVARMADLPAVKSATPTVLNMATFEPGATYADYKEGDKTSGYGLAGLVAGAAALGVAKKAGLLGILLAFGKKGIVILLAVGAGILNWIRGLFGKKKSDGDDLIGTYDNQIDQASEPPPLTTQDPPSDRA